MSLTELQTLTRRLAFILHGLSRTVSLRLFIPSHNQHICGHHIASSLDTLGRLSRAEERLIEKAVANAHSLLVKALALLPLRNHSEIHLYTDFYGKANKQISCMAA